MSREAVLAELRDLREQVTGVTDTIVASADGMLVVADAVSERQEVLAALAAAALGLGKRTGDEAGMGELREVVTRCQGGHIVVYAVRKEALLVVMGDEGLDLARLNLESRQVVGRLGTLLVG